MGILYSNVPPLKINEGDLTLHDYFEKKLNESDTLYIATGYASKDSLLELDKIVREKKIDPVIGR